MLSSGRFPKNVEGCTTIESAIKRKQVGSRKSKKPTQAPSEDLLHLASWLTLIATERKKRTYQVEMFDFLTRSSKLVRVVDIIHKDSAG